MKTKKIYITGMHCKSCEKLLETEFKGVSGVKRVRANSISGEVELDYEKQVPDFSHLEKIAKKFGYSASEEKPTDGRSTQGNLQASWGQWLKAVLIVIGLLVLFRVFQNTGIVDRVNLGSGNISYGVSFLIGMVASISSCLAVVGAVIIAFGEKYKASGKGFFASAVKPNLFFHVGRLATFFVLGGLLGLIGGEISVSGNAVVILTILVSVVMVWLGLNILGFVPSMTKFGIGMPKGLTKHWEYLRESEHKAAPFLLGGLSFLLPCGFTQSMQIYALSSGNFLSGGLHLFFFALGTVPALLLLGITTSWTSGKKMVVFQKVAGIVVVIFAIYTFSSGKALLGVETAVLETDKKVEAVQAKENATGTSSKVALENKSSVSNGSMVVNMSVTSRGFEPSTLIIKEGVPVKWVIDGVQVSGCTNRIIIPSLDESISIGPGENVLEFTPTEKGTIPFSCWMGMVRGKFIVE